MYKTLSQDLEQLDTLLEKIKEHSLAYLKELPHRPTSTDYLIAPSSGMPREGIGTAKAFELFQKHYEPLMVASSGPRYWGFVTGGATPASIAGDWLTAIYDQNTQATKGHGDVSAQLEIETIHLLLDLLELPRDFVGGFVTGATMSNFTCLAVARQWLGNELGKDFAKDGITASIL